MTQANHIPTTLPEGGRNTARRGLLGALAALPVLGAAGAAAAGPGADAELIAACRAYIAASIAYNAPRGTWLEPEDDPLWQAILDAEARVEEAGEAKTWAGVRAQAEVALYMAQNPDGTENFSDSHTGRWPEIVVRAVLRLVPEVTA